MGFTRPRDGRDGLTRYQALYDDVRGHRRSAGTFATEKAADRAWQRAEARMAEGRMGNPSRGRQRFRTYVEVEWLPNHQMEARTRETYSYYLDRHILPWFGAMRMIEVMPADVREWITHLQNENVSAHVIRYCKHRRLKLSAGIVAKIKAHIQEHGLSDDDLLFAMPELPARPAVRVVADAATLDLTRPNESGRRYCHGTLSGYAAGRCRCEHCRGAYASYRAQRRAAGRDQPRRPRVVQTDGHIPRWWFRLHIWLPAAEAAELPAPAKVHGLRHAHASCCLPGEPTSRSSRSGSAIPASSPPRSTSAASTRPTTPRSMPSAGSATAARGLAARDGGDPRESAGLAAGSMPPGRLGHG
jgi:hypothetical protein